MLCKENVSRLIKYVGYGNAAGFLADHGLMAGNNEETAGNYSTDDDESDTEEYERIRDQIDPMTGVYFDVDVSSRNIHRKQCFLVCLPSGNMARKQCFLVCPPLENMARKQCFLVCPPLGNMARKQCFLVCPPSENMARKQCFLVCLPSENMSRKQCFLVYSRVT